MPGQGSDYRWVPSTVLTLFGVFGFVSFGLLRGYCAFDASLFVDFVIFGGFLVSGIFRYVSYCVRYACK